MFDAMSRREHDRFATLAADIASPRIVAAIDKALVENQRERSELLTLREMAVERHGEAGTAVSVQKIENTLTIAMLLNRYRTDQDSSYQGLPSKSRKHYDYFHGRIKNDCGEIKVADLKEQDIRHLHEKWTAEVAARGKGDGVAMARGLITHLRLLINYGATALDDGDCARLSVLLRTMRFLAAKPRETSLTADQVTAIRAEAHKRGLHSIALAQSPQFECGLRQLDVLGEWVPLDDPGESDLIHNDQKWVRGLRWEEIDRNFILRKEIDLRNTTMVMEELVRIGTYPASGPMIVSEATRRPYGGDQFRVKWREVATAAGIPKTVYNMDSRKRRTGARPQNGHTETGWTNHWDIPVGAKAQ